MWTGRPGRAADQLELVDAGGDIVDRGDEPGLVSPALDPLLLCAAGICGIPGTVTWVAKGGAPGEGRCRHCPVPSANAASGQFPEQVQRVQRAPPTRTGSALTAGCGMSGWCRRGPRARCAQAVAAHGSPAGGAPGCVNCRAPAGAVGSRSARRRRPR
ncbi:DUF1152 domain-containing protein [Streptomyces sp. JV185]|uniref:DUF1152 domain-containing protein n=1 Tax=Streptomyces sp. JV185 TaxID=858638 RepID=UPI003FA7261A